ncbi:hypothetical protein KCU95_g3000, partial [Aureobasidium melanogenum]
MLLTEDPPAKVSTILLEYDKVKDEPHQVTIKYYAKDLEGTVNFTAKVPSTIEELKQELRTSIKSGSRYDYQSNRLSVAVTHGNQSLGLRCLQLDQTSARLSAGSLGH